MCEKMQVFHGELKLNDNNEYTLNGFNISEWLYKNYMENNEVSIVLYSNYKRYEFEGGLYKKKVLGKIYDYFIEYNNIDLLLFNLTGSYIEIDIEVRHNNKEITTYDKLYSMQTCTVS